MNRVNRVAFLKFLPVINRILRVCLIVVVSNLVPSNPAIATDKITCVVDDLHYGVWLLPAEEQPKTEQSKSNTSAADLPKAEQPIDPEISDKPVLKALGKDLAKKLDGTGKYESETRDQADLAPGEKFKTASVLVTAQLGYTGTTAEKRSIVSIDARLVRMSNSEIMGTAYASVPLQEGVVWPKSLEEFSSDDFQKSATGQALRTLLDGLATELSQKAPSFSDHLNPPPTKQNLRELRSIPRKRGPGSLNHTIAD
ncbi:MAG: hypothetical protein JST89_25355 [Cyanobacteria bacterium SZAS-4]|nr:hypothetical protein [Cyanobacteria bacterium SZAS-4]